MPPTTRAGPSERAGFTEVPVSGMPMRCTITSAEADGDARSALNGRLVGGEEHDHHEDRRQHHLDEEGAPLADEQVRLPAVPVGAQADCDRLGVQRRRVHHPVEEVGAGDAAGHLGDHVGDALG